MVWTSLDVGRIVLKQPTAEKERVFSNCYLFAIHDQAFAFVLSLSCIQRPAAENDAFVCKGEGCEADWVYFCVSAHETVFLARRGEGLRICVARSSMCRPFEGNLSIHYLAKGGKLCVLHGNSGWPQPW